MSERAPSVEGLVVEPRTPRLDRRIDVFLALLASAAACGALVAAFFADVLPPDGIAIAFFAVAPLAAGVALVILLARSRGGSDAALRWYGCGLAVAVTAMVLQLIAFPTVSPTGGPLGTSGTSSATLYLLYHAAPGLAAVLAAVRAPRPWQLPFTAAGILLAVTLAVDLVPLPELLTAETEFTPLLVGVEYVLAVGLLAAAASWMWRGGRAATALDAWVGVSLFLSFYDVAFNAIGGARFTAAWWASLAMRDASYLVLAFGCLAAVLDRLHRSEAYADAELDRREGQLEKTLSVTRQLLAATAELSRVMRLTDVVRVVEDSGRTSLPGHEVMVALGTRPSQPATPLRQLLAERVRTAPADSREPVFLDRREDLEAWSGDSGLAACGGVGSLAVLPIRRGDEIRGHLLVWSRLRHPWSSLERNLVTGLAQQASLAIVRAEAFEDQARAAHTLQKSLLPDRLPTVPGLSLGALYRPGEQGVRIGGDWYDCIVLDERLVALVIGDVMGKGLRAAAVMGQVRTAVRTAAAGDPSPASVLRVLDEVGLGLRPDEIVTMTYALLDMEDGTATIGRAGHLPPVLVDPEGHGVVFYGGDSTPLGTPDPLRVEERVQLAPGSSIVLYTDGVVEVRDEIITSGIDRLVADLTTAGSALHDDPQAVAESLVEGTSGDDDMALLVAAYR